MLADRSLLVHLSIHCWGNERKCNQASAAAANSLGARQSRIKATKSLVASATFDRIQRLMGELRMKHYSMTMPWSDDNRRLILSKAFAEYQEMVRGYKTKIATLLDQLAEEMPILKEQSKEYSKGLGQVYNEADYPTEEALRASTWIECRFYPVPTHNDIRVEINQEEKEVLKQEILAQNEELTRNASKEVKDRLVNAMTSLRDRLRDYKPNGASRLHQSLIDKVVQVAECLPKINILDDPALDSIAKELKSEFGETEKSEFTKDTMAREAASRKLDDLLGRVGVV